MTDVRPILNEIDAVLGECDASTLEPLELTAELMREIERASDLRNPEQPDECSRTLGGGRITPYHPDTAAADYVTAHLRLGETTKPDPMRGWLGRWLDRMRG